jgi:photosystem II stability/assembly factor-like uncharacterized protein
MRALHVLYLFLAVTLFGCSTTSTVAQQPPFDTDKLQGIEPRNIGPAGMSGRVTSIDVVRSNPDVMYAGTASGGLWRSESGGTDWEPIFDDQGAASIGAVKVYQKNPDIIWVGTGEGNPRNSQTMGAGVYKSIDGGKTWQFMGLEKTRVIHRILIHPDDPNTVWIGAQGNAWADTEQRGVYKTTDGGKTWNKILYNNKRTGVADMVMDPVNPDKIFVAMWEYRRWPWFFESGGEGSGLYVTFDGGETWQERTADDGLPKGELGRMGLAIARSNPKTVYAFVESKENALYKSLDGGFNWKRVSTVKEEPDLSNRPFYYADIYVDPKNENRIYSLWSFVSVSIDGGKSFDQIFPFYNYVHPDHHAFYINPDDPSFLMDGNDGGLNISRDQGKTWRFVENIPVAQYYHVNVDMQFPYNIYGGMQDNGSWQGPAYVWRNGGIRNAYFEELYFGDGFDSVVDQSDPRYAYAMSQRGYVGRVDLKTGNSEIVRPTPPDLETDLRFNWNAPIAVDPFDSKTIYFGSQFLHKSENRGNDWTIISDDLTDDNPEQQRQGESGGLTIDATGAENYNTLTAIAPSDLEQGVIWAGTDDGNVHLTRDGGDSWTEVTGNMDIPENMWVTQIHDSQFNQGEAFVVLNDYRRGNWAPYVMHTTDYGKNWENLVAGKGLEGYTLSFVQDLEEPDLMFVGTEFGLYFSINGGDTWTEWEHGYPTVSTYDMVIHPREQDLVVGTFGRAAWVFDDIRPLRVMAQEGPEVLDERVKLFPTPDAYQAAIREAAGTRFAASAMFSGENRPFGARVSYVVNMPDTVDAEKQEVEIAIYNGDQLVRSFKEKPDHNGLNRMTWNLRRDGVRQPDQPKPKEDEDPTQPSGMKVLPGTYTVKISYLGASDEVPLTVKSDPRMDVQRKDLATMQQMMDRWQQMTRKATAAADQIRDAKASIELVEKLIAEDRSGRDREALAELKQQAEAAKDTLNALLYQIIPEPDDRQGITREEEKTVSTLLGTASYYIQSSLSGPTGTEERLLNQANQLLEGALGSINGYFETEWPKFTKAVQQADLQQVQTYELIK